jgi:hypothetical protein
MAGALGESPAGSLILTRFFSAGLVLKGYKVIKLSSCMNNARSSTPGSSLQQNKKGAHCIHAKPQTKWKTHQNVRYGI